MAVKTGHVADVENYEGPDPETEAFNEVTGNNRPDEEDEIEDYDPSEDANDSVSLEDFWAGLTIPLEEDSDYVNIMVYGKSGVGKTVLGGSDDKVLFIAPEDKGTLSAKRFGSNARKFPVNSWKDIEKAYMALAEAEEEGEIPFNWVVIDSLTQMQAMCMRHILEVAVERNPERDPDIPQIQEWMKFYEMFKRFVQQFNDLNVNVLYTCLVTTREDEDGNEYLAPDLRSSDKNDISSIVSSYMTSFGCMQVKRKRVKKTVNGEEKSELVEYRRITWKDTGPIQGKDRTRALAPYTDITEKDAASALKRIRTKIESYNKTKKESA